MMNMGTVEFTATLDTSRVLPVVEAMDMMFSLLQGYGHAWTAEEQATLNAGLAAVERENLMYSADPSKTFGPVHLACPVHGPQQEAILVAPGDVARCEQCRAPLERQRGC